MEKRKQGRQARLWLVIGILLLVLTGFCAACGQPREAAPTEQTPAAGADAGATEPLSGEVTEPEAAGAKPEAAATADSDEANSDEADKPQTLPEDPVGNSPEWPELAEDEQVVADYLSWLGITAADQAGAKDVRIEDEASGLSLRLPGYWQGLYLLKTSADLSDGACFQLSDLYSHTRLLASQELETETESAAGWLLTIRAVDKEDLRDRKGHSLAEGALSGWVGPGEQVIATDEQYAYCLSEPTDTQFDAEDELSIGIYQMMKSQLQSIVVAFLKDNQLTPNTQLPGLSCYQYRDTDWR